MLTYSVVIPALNEGDYLLATVASILKQSDRERTEIVVVDDGSDDNAPSLVGQKYASENVTVIHNETRQGVAISRATGSDAASNDWLVHIDAHTKFPAKWQAVVESHIAQLDDDGYGYALGGTIEYGQELSRGFVFRGDDAVAVMVDNLPVARQKVMMLSGQCMLIRRDYYHYLGGFDRGLLPPGQNEDAELSWRVWMAGGQCLALSDLRVWSLFQALEDRHIDWGSWHTDVANGLRVPLLYFGDTRLERCIDARLGHEPSLGTVMRLLLQWDIQQRRHELAPLIKRTDDEVFEMFGRE